MEEKGISCKFIFRQFLCLLFWFKYWNEQYRVFLEEIPLWIKMSIVSTGFCFHSKRYDYKYGIATVERFFPFGRYKVNQWHNYYNFRGKKQQNEREKKSKNKALTLKKVRVKGAFLQLANPSLKVAHLSLFLPRLKWK